MQGERVTNEHRKYDKDELLKALGIKLDPGASVRVEYANNTLTVTQTTREGLDT